MSTDRRMVTCPYCGFSFSMSYGRVFGCQGCPQAVGGCTYMMCPRCKREFPVEASPRYGPPF